MKKIFFSIMLWILFWIIWANAGVVDIPTVTEIQNVSMSTPTWTSSDLVITATNLGFRFFEIFKLVMSGLLVIFIVYTWFQMIMSMWNQDDDLGKAKRQIRYSLIAMIFINIPWDLYEAFKKDSINWNIDDRITASDFTNTNSDANMFVNFFEFWHTLNEQIVAFLKVFIFAVAIFQMIMVWISVMTSRWREDKIKEAKNKVTYSIFALIFVWFLEAWKQLAFDGNISDWVDIFSTLINLFLFFAWPVIIFFLTLAAYYYITSGWNEEKVKKAKSIIVNTFIATGLLMLIFTFLLDLTTL